MAFVNEQISGEDAARYGIDEINKDFLLGPGSQYYWTIDRERDIYFRRMKSDRNAPTEHQVSFYWKGALFHIDFKKTGGGKRGSKCWTHWSWNGMRLPKNPRDQEILNAHRPEVIADLKEALAAYRDGGVFSCSSEHAATFDF
jgi:hypothetical protein